MESPIVFSDGTKVLSRGAIATNRMVAAFRKSVQNPAGFWTTFLGQALSLTENQIAILAINGIVSRATVLVHQDGPSAVAYWRVLSRNCRSFLRAYRASVQERREKCIASYEAKERARFARQQAAYRARGAALRAKNARRKKAAALKQRKAELLHRQVEGERRAVARQERRRARLQRLRAHALAYALSSPPPVKTGWEWEPLPTSPLPLSPSIQVGDFFCPIPGAKREWVYPLPTAAEYGLNPYKLSTCVDKTLGAASLAPTWRLTPKESCSLLQEDCEPVVFIPGIQVLENLAQNESDAPSLYLTMRERLISFSPRATVLFNKIALDFSVPGHLEQFNLAANFYAAYSLCPVSSLIEDTVDSLFSGEFTTEEIFFRANATALEICGVYAGKSLMPQGVSAFVQRLGSSFVRGGIESLAAGYHKAVSYAAEKKEVIGDTLSWASEKFFEPLVRLLRGAFEQTLGAYLTHIPALKAQIEYFWSLAMNWGKNLMEKVDVTLQVLSGSTFIAAGLLMVAGLVYMVEQACVSLGLFPGGGSLLGLFIGGLLICWCGASSFLDERIMGLRTAITKMAMFMYSKPRGLSAQGVGDIFGVPLHVMELIGNGLLNTSLSSLTYVGKFGAAMDNIRKGTMCMRQFLGWMLENLASLYDQVSGKKSAFFQELATLAQVDVEKWIRDTQEFLVYAQVAPDGDRVVHDTVIDLKQKGDTISRLLCGSKQQTSFNYSRLVATLNKSLTDVYTNMKKVGRKVIYRKVPFWVYIFGPARCGKSIFANSFRNAATQFLGTSSDNVYQKNARDQFWSGYRQQAVVMVDDLSSVDNPPSLESEFIQLITTVPYGLNMAAVEEKGATFDSKLVITTSNFFTAPTNAKIHDASAYNLRRHACVEVRRAPGVAYDPMNPYASTQARFVSNDDQTPLGNGWMDMNELQTSLFEKYTAHMENQNAEYLFWKSTSRASHDVFDIISNHLHDEAFWFSSSCFTIPGKAAERMLGVDGKVYTFDPLTMHGKEYSGEGTFSADELENMALMKYEDFRQLLRKWSCNGIVLQFIEQLLMGPTHVDSVYTLNSEALASHREFFDDLTLPKRVILRLVQKKVDQIRSGPAFEYTPERGFTMKKLLQESYDFVYNNGGKIFLIFAAIICLWFFCGVAMSLLRTIFVGGAAGGASAKAIAQMSLQSTIPSGSDVNTYMSRNLRRVYRPNRLNLQSGLAKIDTVSAAEQLLAWIELPTGELISCCRFKSRSIALTYHQARAIGAGTRIFISYMLPSGQGSVPIEHIWDPQEESQTPHLRRFNDTEVCVYSHPQLSPLPGPLESLFLEDVQAGAPIYHIEGRVMKLASQSIDCLPAGYDGSQNEILTHVWKGVVSLNTHKMVIDNYEWGGDYTVEVPRTWVGNYANYKEDCGGILFAKIGDGWKVIGMHVAGQQHANGSFTSAAALFPRPSIFLSAQSGLQTLTLEAGKETVGVSKVGYIAAREIPRAPRKSSFEEVQPEYKVPVPAGVPLKQVAILSSDDKRLKGTNFEGYDPLRQATEKYESPMLNLKDDVLEDVLQDIVETWYDCFNELPVLSEEEVVNGNDEEQFLDAIVSNTSEGYPYVLERQHGEKGKERYLEPIPGNCAGKVQLKVGTSVHKDYVHLSQSIFKTVPVLVGMEIPKDERLKESKITTPGTRTFTVLPMPYNLLLRKYFGRFIAALQGNRHRLPCAVGTNPYSREWTQIFDSLAMVNSKALNGDYKAFDGKLNFQMYDAIARLLNMAHRAPEYDNARYNLILAMYGRLTLCGSQVYEVRAGLPSGCAITVVMNSIFNEILIRYAYRVSVGPVYRNSFSTHVRLYVYGDDNLIAISPELLSGRFCGYQGGKAIVEDRFDGAQIKKVLSDVNIIITDGTDKSATEWHPKPLESLDFLKRGFKRMADGRVLAPLDLSAIFSSLHIVRPECGSTLLALHKNVQVALRELYLHQDQELFDSVRNFFFLHGGAFHDLLTWRQCRDFHQEQYTEWTPFKEYKYLEVPLPDTNKLFLNNHAPRDVACVVADQTIVVGPSWRNDNPDKYFVFDLLGPMFGKGGDVCCIPLCGDGSGRIPTDKWIDGFRSPKFHGVQLARDARKAGRIIAFRDNAPFIVGWAAAISFCSGVGMHHVDLLATYSASGGQHRAMVERYFKSASFTPRPFRPGIFA
uniref:RNA1 polyprotein n=1 Tax=Musa nepovirus TaxID=3115780 RepID=A0AAT9JIX4_9SECO